MNEAIEHFNALAHYHRDKYYQCIQENRAFAAVDASGMWEAYEDATMYLADMLNNQKEN